MSSITIDPQYHEIELICTITCNLIYLDPYNIALRIRNDDIDEPLEEILRRVIFDTAFGIEDGIDYSDDMDRD